MKLKAYLPVMAILLGCVACHSPKKAVQTAAVLQETPAPPPPPERTRLGGLTVSSFHEGSNPDSAGTMQVLTPPRMVDVPLDQLPPASASRRAYLATGWWHLNMAFQGSDTTIYRQYKQKWLRFREDQTFDVLINNEIVNTGRWNWDDDANIIYISCRDPYLNNTWRVNEKGFVMVWIGNTDLNVTGIQVRLIGTKTPPPRN